MTHAARSVFWFGVYLGVAGGGLLLAPALALGPAGIPVPEEPWARVAGVLALCLAVYYLVAARSGAVAVLRATVPVRAAVALVFAALVGLGLAPAGLLLFAAVDFAGALWTALAHRTLSQP